MAKLTEIEVALIKNTFKGNEPLMIAIRKILLPVADENSPIGEQTDLWLNVEIDNLPPEQAIINIKARNLFISHLEGGLNKLKVLSEQVEMTDEQKADAQKKDSAK